MARTRARGTRSWRATNLAVLAALGVAFATGVAAVATGSSRGAWVMVAHGVAGLAVVLLIPRKGRVVAGGWRRRRASRWASAALAGLVLASLAAGVVASTGVLRSVAGREPQWVHIALALLLVPPLAWHVVERPVRPRPADLRRRAWSGPGSSRARRAGCTPGRRPSPGSRACAARSAGSRGRTRSPRTGCR